MVSIAAALSFTVAAATLSTSVVDAHGTLVQPQLKFTGTGYGGNFAALVPTTTLTAQPGDRFDNYPDASLNAAAFDRAFKLSKYKSLKEFLLTNQDMSKGRFNMPKTPECGFTDPTSGPVVPLPDELEWYGGKMNHDGPCEVWCDNEIVLPFTANCAVTYPEGKFPYEKAKCEGKSRLTMYWMSTIMEWQVYIDCAKIGEGGAVATNSSSSAATPATTPAMGFDPAAQTPSVETPSVQTPPAQMGDSGAVGGEASSTIKPQCKRKLQHLELN